jgi:peptidyl-prolyl cis-trans isomerase SDCCAG10
MALPTRGRVIVSTTVGEIDIELWSKVTGFIPAARITLIHWPSLQETPKTCRNFLALAMEGEKIIH